MDNYLLSKQAVRIITTGFESTAANLFPQLEVGLQNDDLPPLPNLGAPSWFKYRVESALIWRSSTYRAEVLEQSPHYTHTHTQIHMVLTSTKHSSPNLFYQIKTSLIGGESEHRTKRLPLQNTTRPESNWDYRSGVTTVSAGRPGGGAQNYSQR